MSIKNDTGRIACDGASCEATAPAPVALRPVLSGRGATGDTTGAEGWLFVGSRDAHRHFCPECGPKYLSAALPAPAGSAR